MTTTDELTTLPELATALPLPTKSLRNWFARGLVGGRAVLGRVVFNPAEVARLAVMADLVEFARMAPSDAVRIACLVAVQDAGAPLLVSFVNGVPTVQPGDVTALNHAAVVLPAGTIHAATLAALK
jgi:hypothetical protein